MACTKSCSARRECRKNLGDTRERFKRVSGERSTVERKSGNEDDTNLATRVTIFNLLRVVRGKDSIRRISNYISKLANLKRENKIILWYIIIWNWKEYLDIFTITIYKLRDGKCFVSIQIVDIIYRTDLRIILMLLKNMINYIRIYLISYKSMLNLFKMTNETSIFHLKKREKKLKILLSKSI